MTLSSCSASQWTLNSQKVTMLSEDVLVCPHLQLPLDEKQCWEGVERLDPCVLSVGTVRGAVKHGTNV